MIHALYRSTYEDILLFGWVEAQKRLFPTLSVEQSIGMFVDKFGVGEMYDIDCLSTTYHRMQNKYYESQRTEKPSS